MYDSKLGRFNGLDNIINSNELPNSFNRYNYVANNPMNYVDRDGNRITSKAEDAEFTSFGRNDMSSPGIIPNILSCDFAYENADYAAEIGGRYEIQYGTDTYTFIELKEGGGKMVE